MMNHIRLERLGILAFMCMTCPTLAACPHAKGSKKNNINYNHLRHEI